VNQQRQGEPVANGIGGKVEVLAGRATGCEEMEEGEVGREGDLRRKSVLIYHVILAGRALNQY
jgi:hypothetical protein